MGSQLALFPAGEQRLLDRYQLVGEIASGGMATVYLARIAGLGGFQRFVAIKQLHPHLARNQDFVEMFLDEARLAASIHHQNVVPILEVVTSEGGYYLVMEYVEGVNLLRLIAQAVRRGGKLESPFALRIVIDTLSGLHAAHELTDDRGENLGVVHRDCSPQNILVGLDGCTRITDFGIARASARLATTREGAMKGKLAYMAPEQTQGEGIDRRADLFSVAVVMWEALAQRRLLKRSTEAETLRALLHEPFLPLSEAVPEVEPAVAAVCMKALSRQPEDRFDTAAEMADALERAARQSPRGSEAIASVREVEAFMKERHAPDLASQREAVSGFLRATPSGSGIMSRTTDRGWLAPPSSAGGMHSSSSPEAVRSAPNSQVDLRSVAGAEVDAGEEPTIVSLTAKSASRRRWLAMVGVAVVAVAIIGFAMSPSSPEPSATSPKEQAGMPPPALPSVAVASTPNTGARVERTMPKSPPAVAANSDDPAPRASAMAVPLKSLGKPKRAPRRTAAAPPKASSTAAAEVATSAEEPPTSSPPPDASATPRPSDLEEDLSNPYR